MTEGAVARPVSEAVPSGGDAAASGGVVGPVVAFQGWLAGVDVGGLSDAERVDLVGVLERVKGSVCAVQARATDAVRCSREVVAPVDAARSVGSVVALARREPPSAGDRLVGVARALVHEMPVTMAALAARVISERHAVAVVAATACLSVEDRGVVDARVGPVLPGVGVQGAAGAAGRVAAELDAAAVVARRAAAVASRRVTTPRPRRGWRTCACWVRSRMWSGRTRRCGPGPGRWRPGSALRRVRRVGGWGR
ncbi:hypothetical protein GCM10023168_15390 [Fodinibacter luteus]|uniref:DUF222 domain-containing protein n=1 Tax=Fodinibacter luteus TaxID=552064 RepID=A0ABP8KCR2_9MICO